jgi:hypothetical protein
MLGGATPDYPNFVSREARTNYPLSTIEARHLLRIVREADVSQEVSFDAVDHPNADRSRQPAFQALRFSGSSIRPTMA